jgi:Domain of unknown function (DUF4349)
MNANVRTLASRTGARAATVTAAAFLCGASLLLAGCSGGADSASNASRSAAGHAPAAINGTAGGTGEGGVAAPRAAAAAPGQTSSGGQPASSARTARLLVPGQRIIYTAGLTVRAGDVDSAASLATGIVTGAGGYVAGEQSSINPADRATSAVSLQLKIPVAAYPATLRQLSGRLGRQLSMSQQSQDVTGQVADVSSRVTSARAAITQLRTLLRRAGSINSLLGVQDQINSEESSLEALQAQQRALSRETAYATVALQLVSKHAPPVIHKRHSSHGFVAGLSAGWRALRNVTTSVLTGAGAVLPFALVAALAAGIGYGGWRRRSLRRRSRPSIAG